MPPPAIDRAPLYAEDYGGRGRPVLLVHGLGASSVHWKAVGPILAERYHPIAVDLPGFGRSPATQPTLTVASAVDALSRHLLEMGESAVVVGNSMGGLLAMLLAARHPERVDGLVLIAPVTQRPFRLHVNPFIASLYGAYFWPGLGEAARGIRRVVLGPTARVRHTLDLCVADRSRVPRSLIEALLSEAREQDVGSADRAYLQMFRSTWGFLLKPGAYSSMLARIRVPALLLQGSRDRLMPTNEVFRLARHRSDWTAHLLHGVGHCPQLEASDVVALQIDSWIGSHLDPAHGRVPIANG